MIDGIKVLDLSVSVDALRLNPKLLFPLSVDEKTGAVLNRPRQADDRGLGFTLVPSKSGDRMRCELRGSLHRYHNRGSHNADDFTVASLAATLDKLVTSFDIDPFTSRLNNVEFGVNVQLPFPVKRILDNLICYKHRPFTKEPGDGFDYYQCYTQRYIVKLYDKGAQYRSRVPELAPNILRMEIKVLKMEYLTRQGIHINWLADLLAVEQYDRLGKLLASTFNDILFDEPSINPARLSVRQRDVYQNGRNPKYWLTPEALEGKEYERHRKGLQRTKRSFRALLNQYRQGNDWPRQTASLIDQKWRQLTAVSEKLLAAIDERRAFWQNRFATTPVSACPKLTGGIERVASKKCPKLTGVSRVISTRETPGQPAQKCPQLGGSKNGKMSQINPLSIALNRDTRRELETGYYRARETPAFSQYTAMQAEEGKVKRSFHSPPLKKQQQQLLSERRPSTNQVKEQALPEISEPTLPAASASKAAIDCLRRCYLTGLDISHQRANTWLTTGKTIKQLYTTNRAVYDQLITRFLPDELRTSDIDRQSQAIALVMRQGVGKRKPNRPSAKACPIKLTGRQEANRPFQIYYKASNA